MVFARKTDDALASLVKKLDAEVAKGGKAKAAAVVVILSGDDDIKEKIEKFKNANDVKHVSLALDGPQGPEGYDISKDASVTAIVYKGKKVQTNRAFATFTTKDVEAVTKDLSKLIE